MEDGSRLAPLAQIDRASTMALLDKAISDYVTGSSTVTAEDANRFVVAVSYTHLKRQGRCRLVPSSPLHFQKFPV